MRNWLIGIRIFIALSIVTGIAYPMVMMGIGSAFFADKVRGSLISKDGVVVGSELLGQKFQGKKYFWSRPSAGDYNSMSSAASNMSVTNDTLVKAIADRQAAGATKDLLYASGSGLDPHISPDAAKDQVDRVVLERKLTLQQRGLVLGLIQEYTEARQWGFLGEPRVNVLKLNMALDQKL